MAIPVHDSTHVMGAPVGATGYTIDQFLSSPRLPSLPAVAIQVLELTQDENVDFDEVASVIENDQGLAAKVIRTVNSSYYGLSRPCTSIKQAMVYLGTNTVKTLTLGFSLVDAINGGDDDDHVSFDYVSYWRFGLYAAVAARELATRHEQCEADEAFLAALVQDIGMIAMYRVLGDKYLQAIDMTGGDHRKLAKIETNAFEITHNEVGAAIAERWKFPAPLIECVRFGHDVASGDPEQLDLLRTINLSNAIALTQVKAENDSTVKWIAGHLSRWFNMSSSDSTSLMMDIREQTNELSRLFKVGTGKNTTTDEMMAQAEERLIEVQQHIEAENRALRKRIEDLAKQSLIDPLTGVANRKCFDLELEKSFANAKEKGGCLTVVFCDLDKFKDVNDTHGHQAGDMVLSSLARRLQDFIGMKGLVARYGGEEFAVILPDYDRMQATRLAEVLRMEVQARPIELDARTSKTNALQMTMSLGVASYEPHLAALLQHPSLLLRIADEAVYAAKSAGRNCVRVYHNQKAADAHAA